MAQLSKPSAGLATKWQARLQTDEFLIARLKLTFFYSLTAIIILVGSSFILYQMLLLNLIESIKESRLDPLIARVILDRTKDILQFRFILVDSIVMFFVVATGFFLTQKNLKTY